MFCSSYGTCAFLLFSTVNGLPTFDLTGTGLPIYISLEGDFLLCWLLGFSIFAFKVTFSDFSDYMGCFYEAGLFALGIELSIFEL